MFRYASKSSSRTVAALRSVRRTSFRPSSFFVRRRQPAPPPAEAGVAYAFQLHNPRWISSTPSLLRGERTQNPAIAINKRLVALGKKGKWEDLLEIAMKEHKNFDAICYSTLMSQLARIQALDRKDLRLVVFLQALAVLMETRGLPWIQTRSAANIIHSIGKMKLRNPSTKRILEWIFKPKVAASFVKEGNPQAVANVAWACAKLGFEAPNLFAEIERRSEWLVEEGNPQNVANTAWACATLGFEAPNLFAEIERRSKWLVEEGNPQDVANTAWACATLGFEAPNLFAEIECRSKWLVEKGNPQNVANTAWACAELGYEAPELFAEIERSIQMAGRERESTGCCQYGLGMCKTWLRSTRAVCRD